MLIRMLSGRAAGPIMERVSGTGLVALATLLVVGSVLAAKDTRESLAEQVNVKRGCKSKFSNTEQAFTQLSFRDCRALQEAVLGIDFHQSAIMRLRECSKA